MPSPLTPRHSSQHAIPDTLVPQATETSSTIRQRDLIAEDYESMARTLSTQFCKLVKEFNRSSALKQFLIQEQLNRKLLLTLQENVVNLSEPIVINLSDLVKAMVKVSDHPEGLPDISRTFFVVVGEENTSSIDKLYFSLIEQFGDGSQRKTTFYLDKDHIKHESLHPHRLPNYLRSPFTAGSPSA